MGTWRAWAQVEGKAAVEWALQSPEPIPDGNEIICPNLACQKVVWLLSGRKHHREPPLKFTATLFPAFQFNSVLWFYFIYLLFFWSIVASICNAGGAGSIPGLGRSPGEGNGNPLQYSCLGNPMDRGSWWAKVHGIPKEFDLTFRLNHNTVALQHCVSFCWTMKWTSYMYTHAPFLLDIPPTPPYPQPTPLGHHRAPSWAPSAV